VNRSPVNSRALQASHLPTTSDDVRTGRLRISSSDRSLGSPLHARMASAGTNTIATHGRNVSMTSMEAESVE
jgi:hypothetical protein